MISFPFAVVLAIKRSGLLDPSAYFNSESCTNSLIVLLALFLISVVCFIVSCNAFMFSFAIPEKSMFFKEASSPKPSSLSPLNAPARPFPSPTAFVTDSMVDLRLIRSFISLFTTSVTVCCSFSNALVFCPIALATSFTLSVSLFSDSFLPP